MRRSLFNRKVEARTLPVLPAVQHLCPAGFGALHSCLKKNSMPRRWQRSRGLGFGLG